jgi:hypothetical protein
MENPKIGSERRAVFTMAGCLICFLVLISPAYANKNDVRLDDSKISADVEDILLRDVLDKIRAQKKFSVKGDLNLLDRKISVRFNNLSLRDGLRRILGPINYVLLFDGNKQPAGVILLNGDGQTGRGVPRSDDAAPQLPEAAEVEPEDIRVVDTEGRYENPDLLDSTETEVGSIELQAEDDVPTPPPPEDPGESGDKGQEGITAEGGEAPPDGDETQTTE